MHDVIPLLKDGIAFTLVAFSQEARTLCDVACLDDDARDDARDLVERIVPQEGADLHEALRHAATFASRYPEHDTHILFVTDETLTSGRRVLPL